MGKEKKGKDTRGGKDNSISCRLTREQYELLEKLAMQYDCNMSVILRESLEVVISNPHLMKDLTNKIELKKSNRQFDPDEHWYNSLEFIKSLLSEEGKLAASLLIHFESGFANLYPGMQVLIEDDFIIFKVTDTNEFQLDVSQIGIAYINNSNDDSEEPYRPRELGEGEYVTIWTLHS